MNVVFMNTLEKKLLDHEGWVGRVTIGEREGVWLVLWELPATEGPEEQEVWYEGTVWEDMIVAFRMGVQAKKKEGFHPLIEDQSGTLAGERASRAFLLQFYAELNKHEELYQKLRAWRLELSGKEGKTPFIIATNRTLEMLSAYVPKTKEELRQIPGMSVNRVTAYGEALLGILQQYTQQKPFPLDWVEAEVSEMDFERWLLAQQEAKTRAAAKKQAGKRQLLEGISRGETLDELQKRLTIVRRDLIAWIEELDAEGYDVEPLIDVELRAVSAEDAALAEQAFLEEGDRYLKPVLNRIFDKDRQQGIDMDRTYGWLRLLRLRLRRQASEAELNASVAG
jgi:hypothetical protein